MDHEVVSLSISRVALRSFCVSVATYSDEALLSFSCTNRTDHVSQVINSANMSISGFTLSSTCATDLIEKQLTLDGVAMIGTVSEHAIAIMVSWNGIRQCGALNLKSNSSSLVFSDSHPRAFGVCMTHARC
jgi:hypothetical protein